MNGYGSHTFKLVNAEGEAVYCKFHYKTDQVLEMCKYIVFLFIAVYFCNTKNYYIKENINSHMTYLGNQVF